VRRLPWTVENTSSSTCTTCSVRKGNEIRGQNHIYIANTQHTATGHVRCNKGRVSHASAQQMRGTVAAYRLSSSRMVGSQGGARGTQQA